MDPTSASSDTDAASQAEQINKLKEIAMRYSALRQPERAAPIFKFALDIAEKTFDPYSEVIIGVRVDFGCFFTTLRPRPPEASEFCRRTIDLSEKVFGYSHRVTLGVVRNFIILVSTEEFENFPNDYEDLLKRAITGYEYYHGAGNMLRLELLEFLEIYLQMKGQLLEAKSILEERLGLLKVTRGVTDSKTKEAAINLALCCWQQRIIEIQKHHEIDTKSLQHITRVLELCTEFVSAQHIIVHVLGRMLLCSGDDENACIAFYQLLAHFKLQFGCNGCNCLIRRQDVHAHCRYCKVVDLCQNCHDLYKSDGSQLSHIPAECRNHKFLEFKIDQVQEVDIERWLQDLASSILKSSHEKVYDGGIQDVSNYIGQNANAIYTFKQVEGIPDDLGEGNLQNKPQMWIENLERCLRGLRVLQVQECVPQMLSNWFTPHGYRENDLPEWNNQTNESEELQRHINSILRLALGSSDIQPNCIAQNVEDTPNPGSIYSNEDLTLHSGVPQVRVLELISGNDRTIKAKMRRINLHDNPLPYDALSYVWGAPSSYPQKVLEIDQQQLDITPNLHSALSALLKSNFVGRIWVDAVCINQEDLLERGNQVAMMADIYRHATTVRIYLGPDLPLITRFFQYAERNPNLDIEVPDMITTLHISKEDLLCEYVDLIHRPWWARVWILQEYALARNDPVMYLGQDLVKAAAVQSYWDEFSLEMLQAAMPFSGLKSNATISIMTMGLKLSQIRIVLNNRRSDREGVTFKSGPSQLLSNYFRSKSTDPRDRIFGLRELLEPTAKDVFVPTYGISVAAVYERLAAWVLMFDRDVEIFWMYPMKIDPGAPSWVPDFSRPHSWTPDGFQAASDLDIEVSQSLALGEREKSITDLPIVKGVPPVIYNRVLAIGGREIDTITHVFPVKGGTWDERLRKLWYLEIHFTRTQIGEYRLPGEPFSSILNNHATDMLYKWTANSRSASIALYSQGVSTTEYLYIIDQEFRRVAVQLIELVGVHSLAEKTADPWTLFKNQLRRSFAIPGMKNKEREEKERLKFGTPIAFHMMFLNLSKFQFYLADEVTRSLNVLGAALFDYHNLDRQIRHLSEPRKQSTFDMQSKVMDSVSSTLYNIGIGTFPEADVSIDHPPPYGLKPHIYDELQIEVCDAMSTVEVRLRAALLMRIAYSLRKASERILSNPDEEAYDIIKKSYVDIGDHFYTDWDQLKNNANWIKADDAGTVRLQYLSYGTGIAAIIAAVLSRTSMAGRFAAPTRTAMWCLTTFAALCFVNLRGRFQLSSDVQTPWPVPSEAEIHKIKVQHHEVKNKKREDIFAQGTRHDFTRLSHAVKTQWQNRTFFVTKRGFVGLGTPGVTDIRNGDDLVWLERARFPMVTRKKVGTENLHLVGFSVIREFINEDITELEDLKQLRKRVFKFV